MQTRDFLERVLGDSGHYCIFGLKTDGSKRVQKFYPSIDKAMDAAASMDDNGMNAYFALATFNEAGKRTQDNVNQMRALFLDLDCGPEKEFDSQQEAIAELKDFCKLVGMPKPLLVNSGRGVHVYWPLTEPVPAAEWVKVAARLKEACVKHRFKADPNVTDDSARILRVPGTHNYKDDPAKPVQVLAGGEVKANSLEFFAEKLSGYAPSITFDIGTNSLFGKTSETMQRLLGNKEFVFKDILMKTAKGKGCAQLKYIVTQSADMSEPMWRAGLSIAKFCSDGHKAAHKISNEHPDYSPRQTEKKLDAIKGPYTCETFNKYRPGVCTECPLWGKIKSPISLGGQIKEAEEEDNKVEAESAETGVTQTFVIPSFPKPYFRGRKGGIYVQMRDDDGDPYDECIYPNDLYFVRRVYDPIDGESLVARLHLPHDGVREFTVTLGQVTSSEELRKALSSRGVVAGHKKAWEKIMAYSNSWVSHLQSDTIADTAHQQFGWTDDEKLDSFVIGNKEVFADRVEFNPPTTATASLMPAFSERGTPEGWKEQANFFNRDGMEPFQFMVCLTLAAPLMAMTPYNAAMYSLYSDGSGHGKTTAQKIALGAFGDPERLIMQSQDTVNYKMNRMDVLKNLPGQWDEVTNLSASDASDLLYMLQNGMQKGRMSSGSNAERVTGDPWKTTCGFTSNESLITKVRNVKARPEGETYRLLEYHARAFNFASKAETDELSNSVGRHYGHAAVEYLQYIMQNKEEVAAAIKTVQRQIDTKADLKQKDRFWSVTAAVTVTACMLGNKLGLLSYDVKKLRDWAVELILENKRQVAEATATIDVHITNYVTENYGSILWIRSTEEGADITPGSGLDNLVAPEHEPRVKFIARYETDTKMLYLMPKPFQKWCADQHLNYNSALKEITEHMGGERKKMRLTKGTKLSLPPVNTIAVDCSSLELDSGGSKS